MWSWFPPSMVILTITASIIVLRWSRARFGCGAKGEETVSLKRTVELLNSENGRLTGQISRLEERVAVLERIATDSSVRLGHEIDALR